MDQRCTNYSLPADILGFDNYYKMPSIDTYAVPNEPVSYDPTITNATLTHKCKHKDEEWDLVHTAWFICKGFLKSIVDNLRDALNKKYA